MRRYRTPKAAWLFVVRLKMARLRESVLLATLTTAVRVYTLHLQASIATGYP